MDKTTPSPKLTESQLPLFARVLMGAAHADGRYEGREEAAIRQVLSSHDHPLSESVEDAIGAFSEGDFDLGSTCKEMGLTTVEGRAVVLRAVAEVTEVDDVLEPTEHTYLDNVAKALGAGPFEVKALQGPGGFVTTLKDVD